MKVKFKINSYNYTRYSNYNSEKDEDDEQYLIVITDKRQKLIFKEGQCIGPREFRGATNLKKIWIPSTIGHINADSPEKAPFFGCPSTCIIFTDITDENNLPVSIDPETGIETALISPYWNNYSETGKLQVNYSSTIYEFNEY